MITSVNNISSGSLNKTTAKPPPPVPPRPSKDIVAEALRKRRNPEAEYNATVPARMAPPPPNPIFTRSISDDLKSKSRTVIFQSSNMKKSAENTMTSTHYTTDEVSVKSTESSVKITQNSSRKSSESSNDDAFVSKVFCTVQNGSCTNEIAENPNEMMDLCEDDKNHVNMLIDEMFSSVLDDQNDEDVEININEKKATMNNNHINNNKNNNNNNNKSTILIIETNNDGTNNNSILDISDFSKSNDSTMEKKKSMTYLDDKKNAEFLIEELASMRIEQERITKRQRKPSKEIYKDDILGSRIVNLNIVENEEIIIERLKMMSSLHGLPPLPKSLSGFNINENFSNPPTPMRTSSIRGAHQTTTQSLNASSNEHLVVYPPHHTKNSPISSLDVHGRQQTNLDSQLAILRREMYSLRQLDLSLLSQLWSLNESIQDFRQMLQEQEDCRVLSPPSPSPAPSSGDEGDADDYYVNAPPTPTTTSLRFRPAPPPPPTSIRRPNSNTSSNTSTGVSEMSH